jgi:hypothetical protein
MVAIIRKLPFYDRFTTVEVHGQRYRVFPYQILVWVSLGPVGERDAPFLLELHRGIGVSGEADLYPRLPLLGARALRQGRLQLVADYARSRVSLRTPGMFSFLGWR